MYKYPARPTGTAQDLMNIVTRAGELVLARDGTVLPRKTALARALWEPPFNLGGALTRILLELLPADKALAFHDAVYRSLSGGKVYPFDAASPSLARAAAEARALEAETGRPPALVVLLSHPPVLGDMAHLNFELVRHAGQALRAVRGRPCRPRLVAAVDPYALDTAGVAAEGLYAGFMGLYHLGIDRLSFVRGPLSALVLRETAWPRLAPRLLRRLSGGGEVVMALSGGIPATARILYTAREWAAAARRRSPRRGEPAEVLRRLRQREDFRRFEGCGANGPGLRRCAWRLLEGWVMSALAGDPWNGAAPAVRKSVRPAPAELPIPQAQGPSCADTGALSPGAGAVAQGCLDALGIDGEARAAALAGLAEEWSRETPYRRRLFRVLAGRILARGRPVVFLPVVHQAGERLGVLVREAWSWRGMSAGRIQGRAQGERPRDWQGTAEEFAVDFVRANYA